MIRSGISAINLDAVGFSASFLCAIHCAVLPLVLTISALSGLHFLGDEKVEIGIIIFSALVAIASLIPGYFKHHRKKTAIIIAIIGFVIIGAGRVVHTEFWEAFLTTIGALGVASAHFINWRHCRACRHQHVSVMEKTAPK